MECEFEPSGENYYTCRICGLRVRTTNIHSIHHPCPGTPRLPLETPPTLIQKPQPYPTLAKQATTYLKAITTHLSTGSQTRTDAQVAHLLTICQTCEKFDPTHQRCLLCGCRCTTSPSPFLNKLRMASQKCPLKKW